MSLNNDKNFFCEFCKKTFTTSYNLTNHQKTAKFCLVIQNKPIEEVYKCNFCNKGFTLKSHYSGHLLICKDKKVVEEKEQSEKLIEQNEKLIKENNELRLKLSIMEELNKKLKEDNKELKKTNKELIKRPSTSTTSIVNDNRQQNQYNIQFNQLFDKLPILNEINVNNRINELSTENKINEYDLNNFYTEALEKITHQLKDLSFCTDPSRKIVVVKDESEKSIKMNAEEFLSKCFDCGSESITNHIQLTDQIVNERIDNNDPDITSEMLDHFNDDRDNFLNRIKNNKINYFLTNNQTDNRIEASVTVNYIKKLEKLSK